VENERRSDAMTRDEAARYAIATLRRKSDD
jgi:hypothetical protein